MTADQFFKMIHHFEQENTRWRVIVAIQSCAIIYLSFENIRLILEKEKKSKKGA